MCALVPTTDIISIPTMLLLTNSFLNRNVMSLRNGRPVATSLQPIINPNNLKIEAFYCQDSIDKKKTLVLLSQDIRDILPAGIVINDHDVLTEAEDLIRLKPIIEIGFTLIGKQVVTENKKKLGKINDYACDSGSLYIKKLYVSQSVVKSFSGGNLSIDRNQIIEITNRKIVVKDPLQQQLATSKIAILNTAPAA